MADVRLASLTVENRQAVDAFAQVAAAASRVRADVEETTSRLVETSAAWKRVEAAIPGSAQAMERFSAQTRQARLALDQGRIGADSYAIQIDLLAKKYFGASATMGQAAALEAQAAQAAAAGRAGNAASLRQAAEEVRGLATAYSAVPEHAGKAASSTKLAAWQVTNLVAQFQDAAVQLQGGQNPLTILMQQGPQATAAVGGVGRALSLLVSPVGLAAVGVTAFAAALAVGLARATTLESELRKLAATQAAYNNQTQTASQAQAAAHAMADNSPWFSRSDADAAIAELTKFRTLSAQTLRDIQADAADFAHATGKDLADGAADLAQAFAKGYSGIKQLDDAYGFLDAAQLKQIRNLYEQGRGAEAARIAMAALSTQMHDAADLSKGPGTDNFAAMVKAWQGAMDTWAQSDAVQTALKLMRWTGEGVAIWGGAQIGPQADPELAALNRIQKAQGRLDSLQGVTSPDADTAAAIQGQLSTAQSEYDQAVDAWKQVVAAREKARSQTANDNKASDAVALLNQLDAESKEAGQLTETYARQSSALAANADARERLQIEAEADAKVLAGELQAANRQLYVDGEMAKRKAERIGASRDVVTAANAEARAADQIATAYGHSIEAGAAEEIQQQAAVAVLTKRVPLEQAMAEVKANAAKSVAQQVASSAQAQASYGQEEAALQRVAEAARASADGEHKAQDAAQASAKYADLLAKARVSGSADEVTAVESLIEAEQEHLAVMRSLNAEAEANRQLRQGERENTLSASEIAMIQQGVRPEDRERILQFERERVRIREQGYSEQKTAELEAQARLSADQAAARKFWGEVEDFVQDITTTLSSSVADALIEGGENGAEQLKKALLRTVITIPVNLVMQSMLTPLLMQGAAATVSALGLGSAAVSGSGLAGAGLSAGASIANQTGNSLSVGDAAGIASFGASQSGYGVSSIFGTTGASINAWAAGNIGTGLSSSDAMALVAAQKGSIIQSVSSEGSFYLPQGSTTAIPIDKGVSLGTYATGFGAGVMGSSLVSTFAPKFAFNGSGGMAYNIGGGAAAAGGMGVASLMGAGSSLASLGPYGFAAWAGYTIASGIMSAFGLGKKPKPPSMSGTWDPWADQNTFYGVNSSGLHSTNASLPDWDSIRSYTQQYVVAAQDLASKMGLAINGPQAFPQMSISISGVSGLGLDLNNEDNQKLYVLGALRDMAKRGGLVGDDIMTGALAHTKADTIDEYESDLSFAKSISATRAALTGLTDTLGDLKAAAKASVTSGLSDLVDELDRAKDLGIGTQWQQVQADKLRQTLRGITTPELTDAAKTIANIVGQIDGLRELNATLGLGLSGAELDAAQAQAVSSVGTGFTASVHSQYLSLTDPTAAALSEWQDWADKMRHEARDAGADMVEVEKLIAAKRLAILKDEQAAVDQAQSTAASSVGQVTSAIGALLTKWQYGDASPLSEQDQYDLAARTYNAVSGAAMAGDFASYQGFSQAADQYLSEARTLFGSGADYVQAFDRVISDASRLLEHDPNDLVVKAVEASSQAQIVTLKNGFSDLKASLQAVLTELRQASNRPARMAS